MAIPTNQLQAQAMRQQAGVGAGGLGGAAMGLECFSQAGLRAAQQQYRTTRTVSTDSVIPIIKYKPTIKAGDPIRDVLQAETDEWLKEVK